MSRVMVLGIDGMDSGYLQKAKSFLPTISMLGDKYGFHTMKSTFPPDSSTAWATIYTGLPPSEHRVYHFGDVLSKVGRLVSMDEDNSSISGKTFWDEASRVNRRVVVFLPHLGYPSWYVNGIMVSRSAVSRRISTYPSDFGDNLDRKRLYGVRGFPARRNIDAFIRKAVEHIELEAEAGAQLAESQEWDLFFAYSSGLDLIEHFLWSEDFCSRDWDLMASPDSKKLLEVYRIYDRIIKGYSEIADKRESSFVLLSDHGHGPRPVMNLAVNALLETKGLAVSKKAGTSHGVSKVRKMMIDTAMRVLPKTGGADLLRMFTGKMAVSRFLIDTSEADLEECKAYCPPMSGIKTYPFGVIIVNVPRGTPEYEGVRDEIISSMLEVTYTPDGSNAVKWIRRGEEVFHSKLGTDYPDIVFELDSRFGVSSEFGEHLFSPNRTKDLVPGTHRTEGAVLMIMNQKSLRYRGRIEDLTDIHSMIVNLLEL